MKRYAPITIASLALGAALLAIPQLTQAQEENKAPTMGKRAQRGMQRGMRGHHPQRVTQRLARRLNLTAEQQAQLKPILEQRAAQFRAVVQDQTLNREQKHAKLKPVREATQSQIAAVLTDEQKQKLAQAGPRMERRQHGRRAMNPERVVQQLSRRLDLTTEQQALVKPLVEQQAAAVRAVVQDQSLTREQKREKIRPLLAQSREQLAAMLTPEQLEKLNAMQQRMQNRFRRGPRAGQPQS